MNVEFTGRGTTVNPRHRKMADDALATISRILGASVSAHIVLGEDKYRQIAEVTVMVGSEALVGRCEGSDLYNALHDALKRVEAQAIKFKERRITVERHAKPDSAAPLIEVAGAA